MNNFVITPSSDLKLLKVPIQIDERNQLDFATLSDQYNYFNNLTGKIEAEKFTYIREDSVIRFEACIDDIIDYNYVMYRNSSFSNKWFYAFIENMEYKSNSMTDIKIKEDSFQTWMFDITYKPSFIERKHATDDRIGANLKEEGLATGEYMINGTTSSSSLDYVGVVTATEDPIEVLTGVRETYSTEWGNPNFLGGVPSGLYMLAFPLSQTGSSSSEDYTLDAILEFYAKEGKSESITGVYICPKNCLDYPYTGLVWDKLYYNPSLEIWSKTNSSGTTKWINYFKKFKTFNEEVTITKPTSIDGYTPRNNKLLTGEYNYLLIDNNNGGSAKLNFELFSTSNCLFNIYGVPTPSGSIRCIPKYYNGKNDNNLEGLNGGKLPIGAWNTDVYTNWLTQNGVNVFGMKLNAKEAGIIGGGIQIATGILGGLLGNPVGFMGALGGIGDIQDTMKENYRHSITPPQSEGNTNCGDVAFATGNSNFVFYNMCIRNQFARSIDNFFDMFGYKFDILETPNLHTRTYWNYIKTRGLNIVGNIPQKSTENIKRMFDNGITIWHNGSYFLDYSQNNTVLEAYIPQVS